MVDSRWLRGVAGLFLALGWAGAVQAADWPNYRGPNHDGVSAEAGWQTVWPQAGPAVAWKASLGAGFASMSIANGRVYAAGNVQDNDVVYCFDAVTGKSIWKQSYPCPVMAKNHEGGPCATPTVEGDAVYVFSKKGDVLRLNAETGAIVWNKNLVKEFAVKNLTWYFASSPVIVDDLVVLNAGTSGVALKKADGSLGWKSGTDPAGYATAVPAVIGGHKTVLLAAGMVLYCVEASTGKVLWAHPWRTQYDINAADPIVVDDGKVFISSGYGRGCALLDVTADTAKEAWTNTAMRNQCYGSVLWQGHLYGFDGQVGGSGKLACMDAKTGQVKWTQGGMGTGTLMLADGKLIILSEAGKLVVANASPAKFEELASAQILQGKCWTVPVLANGLIYARNAAGDMVCVDVRK